MQLDGLRHWPGGSEEVPWTTSTKRSSRDQVLVAIHARPVVYALDEAVLHGIRCRVDQLCDDGLAIEQPDDAWLLSCPEVLKASTECVLTAREHLVEVFD